MLGKEYRLDNEVNLAGIYIALVVDNMDPLACERIRVRVIGVHDLENTDIENSVWTHHVGPSKSSSGEIPDIGDYVYVMFLQNDPMHIVWLGWVRVVES